MARDRDDLVRIDAAGVVHPVGETARVRLQGRAGTFHSLPAPAHMVVLRRAEGPDTTETRPCLLSGEVRAAGSLCDVLSFLGTTPTRGELVVLEASASRSLFVDGGYVVGARSSVATERLGEVLYAHGVLDQNALARCQELAVKQHLRLGEAAVQLGFVDRQRLFALTGTQAQEIVHAALLASSGAFYFLESFDEGELEARHHISVATLVRDTVKRMHETRYFRARIPSPKHVPVALPGAPPADAELARVLATVDGRRSVADVGRDVALGEFDVTRALFQLVQSGHVAIRPPRLSPTAVVDVFNSALALLLRELDAIDEGDAVRLQLATRVSSHSPLSRLLAGAGPADDGTFDGARIVGNVPSLSAGPTGEETMSRLLHEHVSYALFLARPHLRRAAAASSDPSRSPVSIVVSSMIDPIAPRRADGSPDSGSIDVTDEAVSVEET
jgi:hypothetical protein